MDFVDIILIITAAIGLGMMSFTIARLREDGGGADSSDTYLESGNSIKAINTSLDEAEKAVEELNKFAESVMNDINEKHQELLFVYNLIEEKKNEVSGMYGKPAGSYYSTKAQGPETTGRRGRKAQPAPEPVKRREPEPERRDIHPRYREIKGMYENGASIAEISKALDMGQGEVKLIIELAKAR